MAGKGDKTREVNVDKFISNYERIFGKKTEEEVDTSDVEAFSIQNARHLILQQEKFEQERKRQRNEKN